MSILGNNLFAAYYAQQNFGPRSNEVWYWADEQVMLYSQKNVVSHTFADGKGVVRYGSTLTTSPISFRGTPVKKLWFPNSILEMNSQSCVDCASLVSVILPESITSIGAYCFINCTSLLLDSLPETVQTLNSACFRNCISIGSLVLPDSITLMDDGCFYGCSNLDINKLPSNVTGLGNCFVGCASLIIKEIPASVKTLGPYTFAGCSSLTEITFNGTPDSITSNVFNRCSNLTTIRVPWSSTDSINADAPWGATNATIVYNYQP